MTPTFAKERARLLRRDLADAGFEVPHSLTLELVAHQHGFRDWNHLAANDQRRHPDAPFVEHEDYDHVASTMTLGELRDVIGDQPDELPVLVAHPTAPDSTSTRTIPAGSAEVRSTLATDHRPALVVTGDFGTGRYRVPPRLLLELTGLPLGGGPAVAAVIDAVQDAVDDLGFRGEHSMSNDTEAGAIEWSFQATEGVSLDAVEDVVRRTVAKHAKGDWSLRRS